MSVATVERHANSGDGAAMLLGERLLERAVLVQLLDVYPRRMTVAELTHEMDGPQEHRVVARAVGNLAAAQLLHREGEKVKPAATVVAVDRVGAQRSER